NLQRFLLRRRREARQSEHQKKDEVHNSADQRAGDGVEQHEAREERSLLVKLFLLFRLRLACRIRFTRSVVGRRHWRINRRWGVGLGRRIRRTNACRGGRAHSASNSVTRVCPSIAAVISQPKPLVSVCKETVRL